MIAHVVRQALAAVSVRHVIVATDHAEIAAAAAAAGAEPVMTESELPTGTDRVAAALRQFTETADVVVNVQGDEPLVQPSSIDLVAQLLLAHPDADIATLCAPLPPGALRDPSKVKVVCGPPVPSACGAGSAGGAGGMSRHNGSAALSIGLEGAAARRALFFSRAPIGVERATLHAILKDQGGSEDSSESSSGGSDADASDADASDPRACAARLHVGLYAFRPLSLQRFVELPPSPLESLEQLEQLRALEAGMSILVSEVAHASAGIDTVDDVARLERMWREASAEERRAMLGVR